MSNSSRRSYTLDITTNTLTVSASFADAMNDPTSAEYELVRKFQHDFRGLRIVRKTHATPKRYKNSDGSITTRNKKNGLTYDRMERFMCALPDATDYLEAFYDVKEKAEKMCLSPYAVVSDWFMKQFPKFRSNPMFYLWEQPKIICFEDIGAKLKPEFKKTEGEQETA